MLNASGLQFQANGFFMFSKSDELVNPMKYFKSS